MAGFGGEFSKVQKPDLSILPCVFLQTRIQMDADADDCGKEGIAFSGMDAHIVQMVVIQHPVVYPFAGSTVVVDFLIFRSPSGYRSIESDVPVGFGIDAAAIGGRGTLIPACAGAGFATGERAAPFAGMLLLTIAPVDHTETGHAQRRAVFINGDGIRNGSGPPPVRVEVNKRSDLPFLAKAICGIVVMCRVQTDIPDRDVRIDGCEFPKGNNRADAVMPPGVKEADMERQVNADMGIVGAEHVKGVSEIKDFLIAVPAPVCVGIGEMPVTGAVGNAVFAAIADFMSMRGCVGMDAGAVAGNGNAVCGDEAVFKGRDEDGKPEDLLKPFFIMERKNRMLQRVNSEFVCNAGMPVGKFLSFSGFFGWFGVLIFWKKVLSTVTLRGFRLSPEPVHKVKVRADGRQGIRGTADKQGEQTVCLKLPDPGGKAGEAKH